MEEEKLWEINYAEISPQSLLFHNLGEMQALVQQRICILDYQNKCSVAYEWGYYMLTGGRRSLCLLEFQQLVGGNNFKKPVGDGVM